MVFNSFQAFSMVFDGFMNCFRKDLERFNAFSDYSCLKFRQEAIVIIRLLSLGSSLEFSVL